VPILSVLSEHEQKEFDYPPILSAEARVLCFTLSKEVEKQIARLRTPTNKNRVFVAVRLLLRLVNGFFWSTALEKKIFTMLLNH